MVSLSRSSMNDGSPHELAAAYALDALDGEDLRAYEAHLATCERCREDVASFRAAASALAYDVDLPPVPEALEHRIAHAARAERPNVATLQRRWVLPVAGIAAAAAAAAIVLGIWAIHLSNSLDRERSARERDARIVAILAQPGAKQIPTQGRSGLLVVAPSGKAVLLASGLRAAGHGKTYEAWVVEGKTARPAGTFPGGAGSTVVELTKPVAPGSVVGVTLEPAGGSANPTLPMLLRAGVKRPA